MGKQVGNAVRTAIWAVVFTAAVAFVLAVSMRGTGPVASGTGHPAPAAPVAESPSASSAAGRAAAAWSQFGSGVDVMVRAEDVQGLKGLMVLGEAPDNAGVLDASGRAATVHYVWCEDDGIKDEEPAEGGERPAPGEHSVEHSAAFSFEVPEAGTYYPWARVWWQDSCGNSVILVIEPDGGTASQYVVQEGANQWWQWLPVAAEGVELPKGLCRLTVKNREDGARLSRVLFTTRSYTSYKPETPEG